jgi:hypothetical protein
MIFVFGSNLSGIHGAGAARYAQQFKGAIIGIAKGFQGNSYAIPTKDAQIRHTLPLMEIKVYVDEFKQKALEHSDKEFQVTRIGCGLAGLRDEDVAPLFVGSPPNCQFDELWKPWLGTDYKYWGSF